MEQKLIYKSRADNLVHVNESFEKLMKRLGAKVVNSAYILSEGLPTEAYGYYIFEELGIVTTVLISKNSECHVSVNFSGFEDKIESYNKLKMYIEDTLKKVLY